MVRSAADGSGASGAIEPFAEVGRLLPSGVTNVAGGGPSHGPSTRTSIPDARSVRARAITCIWTPPGIDRLYGENIPTRSGLVRTAADPSQARSPAQRPFGHGSYLLEMTEPSSSVTGMPALSLIGVPGKRGVILDLAAEAERRGFAGLASPGINGNLALCGSLAHVTSTIPFWTSIQPIYHSHPAEVAITAGHIAEVSGGRFRLGLGVSHAPAMKSLGIDTGKPLSDMRTYVEGIRGAERPRRHAAADLPGHAARQDARPRGRRRRRGHLGQRLAAAHAHAGGPHPGRRAGLVLPGEHGADGDRRRQGRGAGHPPAHARPAT